MEYRALIPLKANGKEYAPGDIVPGAPDFPNIRDLVAARYLEAIEGAAETKEVKSGDLDLQRPNGKRKGRR